jgi:hypothetical protein
VSTHSPLLALLNRAICVIEPPSTENSYRMLPIWTGAQRYPQSGFACPPKYVKENQLQLFCE